MGNEGVAGCIIEVRAEGAPVIEDITARLQAYYSGSGRKAGGGARRVSKVTALAGGWESAIYSFTLSPAQDGSDIPQDCVLRLYEGDHPEARAAHEFQGMAALHRLGYPVPSVFTLEQDASFFGRPFVVMERIAGKPLWSTAARADGESKRAFLGSFVGLYARLHRLDTGPFLPHLEYADVDAAGGPVLHELRKWRYLFGQYPVAGFAPVMEWLELRGARVAPLPGAVVHWDLHPENVLLRDDGSMVVIDWTHWDVTDPRFDLAWTMLLVGAYPGWGEAVLREYERMAGLKMADMEYFQAAGCVRRLMSVVIALTYGPERLGMRAEAAPLMRRHAGALKGVYDLLKSRAGLRVPEVEALLG